MSTDDDLRRAVDSQQIIPLRARLRPNQQPYRRIYITPMVAEWIRTVLVRAETDNFMPDSARPVEQFDTMTRRFCAGEDLDTPIPHLMNPTDEGIWRFKSADIRAVGWAPVRGVLIVSEMDLKINCTNLRDNQMMLNAVLHRRKLNISSGHYLIGGFNDCF